MTGSTWGCSRCQHKGISVKRTNRERQSGESSKSPPPSPVGSPSSISSSNGRRPLDEAAAPSRASVHSAVNAASASAAEAAPQGRRKRKDLAGLEPDAEPGLRMPEGLQTFLGSDSPCSGVGQPASASADPHKASSRPSMGATSGRAWGNNLSRKTETMDITMVAGSVSAMSSSMSGTNATAKFRKASIYVGISSAEMVATNDLLRSAGKHEPKNICLFESCIANKVVRNTSTPRTRAAGSKSLPHKASKRKVYTS
mmetsp:Transcript_69054/g.179485  ORF Transcript_69054/g.179485 Transcript_69054/m.179485 type:complete len:256 (-) Transcript_69054:544-1311(-)